jgi:hypothetical protein
LAVGISALEAGGVNMYPAPHKAAAAEINSGCRVDFFNRVLPPGDHLVELEERKLQAAVSQRKSIH